MTAPADIWSMTWKGKTMTEAKVSNVNDEILASLDRTRPESVKVKIEDGEMQMWVLKPPGFDPKKKWPVAFLVPGRFGALLADQQHPVDCPAVVHQSPARGQQVAP